MRFTHIVNKLQNLGKDISNQYCTNKVLICMTRDWQPKVIAIKESQNRNILGITTLFVQTFYNNRKNNPQQYNDIRHCKKYVFCSYIIFFLFLCNFFPSNFTLLFIIRGMLATLTFQHSLSLTFLLAEINICSTILFGSIFKV